MKDFSNVGDEEFVFASILLVANKMDTLLERKLSKFNITSKQWFLLLGLFNAFDKPPTIKELANEMGSSHQNVKQVALKLQEKGMIILEKDKKDLRATRLIPTEKSYKFLQDSSEDGRKFMSAFYSGIDDDNLNKARLFISKIMLNLNDIDEEKE
jgi:DNA-binding MarR family transcriptional regulator